MSRKAETPLEAARRYVTAEEAKIDKQRLVISRLAAGGQSTVKAKRDLAGMELALILLPGRVARLLGPARDDAYRAHLAEVGLARSDRTDTR